MWAPTAETKSGTDRDVPDAARSSSTLDLVEAPPRSRLKPDHPALGPNTRWSAVGWLACGAVGVALCIPAVRTQLSHSGVFLPGDQALPDLAARRASHLESAGGYSRKGLVTRARRSSICWRYSCGCHCLIGRRSTWWPSSLTWWR